MPRAFKSSKYGYEDGDKVAKSWVKDITEDQTVNLGEAIDHLVFLCHTVSVAGGWWHNEGEPIERNVGEQICLMHSELSEGMEGERKDLVDDHLPEFDSITVELADAMTRIFDYAGGRGINLGAALIAKLKYNQQREDHKIANRIKAGGKSF